jgi:electron transfer flavoprotein alpha subunit
MNAWTDMNRLIGASGQIISPKLCIVAGVSGTAVFSVGIKNSEFIVAVNTDSNAPIFQMAHVGIVGDLQGVLSELAKVITAEKAIKSHHRPVPAIEIP